MVSAKTPTRLCVSKKIRFHETGSERYHQLTATLCRLLLFVSLDIANQNAGMNNMNFAGGMAGMPPNATNMQANMQNMQATPGMVSAGGRDAISSLMGPPPVGMPQMGLQVPGMGMQTVPSGQQQQQQQMPQGNMPQQGMQMMYQGNAQQMNPQMMQNNPYGMQQQQQMNPQMMQGNMMGGANMPQGNMMGNQFGGFQGNNPNMGQMGGQQWR